jgi:1,2-diacylglycerol 3-beta-galactosyltransferase
MRDVLVFFSDAGGGHRNAVNALVAAVEERRAPFRLVPVNLSEALADFDLLRRLGGRSIEETYNELLRRGRTRHLVPLLRLLHATARVLHRPMLRALAGRLAQEKPAAVLSVHPNFNGLLRDAVRRALPGAPFVVLLTDYADFPPHFWIEPGVDRVIVGSAQAREQALALGLPAERVTLSSGMVLHPRFHHAEPGPARAALRAELGLAPEDFLVLLLFGGKGAAEMEPLAQALLAEHPRWHVLAICGRNAPLVERLLGRAAGAPRLHVLGFTERVADCMAASDVLLTKPGPGSLAEAFERRIPVVVTCHRGTIPQERFNADLVAREGLGLVVRDWREMPAAAGRVAHDPDLRARLRARLDALPRNRAVYEALDVLESELARLAPR